MNLERLEMMRVMLERVVAGSWEPDQNIYAEINRPKTLPLKVEGVRLYDWCQNTTSYNGNFCGFNACAVGHACFDEEFRKLGWSWSGNAPKYGGLCSWAAVYSFFDFSRLDGLEMGEKLFASSSYSAGVRSKYDHLPTTTREAKMVATRIQHLIEHGVTDLLNKIRRGIV